MMGFKDYLALIGIILAVIAVVVVSVGTPAYFGTKYKCRVMAEQMELPYEWGPVKGCFVRENNKWVPVDQLRSMR